MRRLSRAMHLVSSSLASLLIGGDAPLDPGDASRMNLMNIFLDLVRGRTRRHRSRPRTQAAPGGAVNLYRDLRIRYADIEAVHQDRPPIG